jgi:hypothetical protein
MSLLGLTLGQYSYRQDRASSFLLQVTNNYTNNTFSRSPRQFISLVIATFIECGAKFSEKI